MRSFILRSVLAALLAAELAPAAFAQSVGHDKVAYRPYASVGRAPVCSQLELRLGFTGHDCGMLSMAELSKKTGHAKTN
jgi:hypothetical protein